MAHHPQDLFGCLNGHMLWLAYKKHCGSGTWKCLGLSWFQLWWICHVREIISAASLPDGSDPQGFLLPSIRFPFVIDVLWELGLYWIQPSGAVVCAFSLNPVWDSVLGSISEVMSRTRRWEPGNPCQTCLTPRIVVYRLPNPITSFPPSTSFSHLLLILALFWHPSENLTGRQSSQNFCGFLPKNPKSRAQEESLRHRLGELAPMTVCNKEQLLGIAWLINPLK